MSHFDDAMPVRFLHLTKEKFPVRMLSFAPDGQVVNDSGDLNAGEPYEIEGLGPGSVRYSLWLFGDGTVDFMDDPTCGGTVPGITAEENGAMVARLLDLIQETGREMTGMWSRVAKWIEDQGNPEELRTLKKCFEMNVLLGERMLEAADSTRTMLKIAAEKEDE